MSQQTKKGGKQKTPPKNGARKRTTNAAKKNDKPLKVAIVGFTPSHLDAPWDDDEWEIWGLNALYKFPTCKRADRWFDVHRFSVIPKERTDQYRKMGIPVYMQRKHDDVPNSVELPRDEIEAELGNYVTNSISWMIAVAILEGAEAIHVYGIDMAQQDEYCVAPETRVLTSDLRWVGAGDLDVGDEVMAFDEQPGGREDSPAAFRQWRVATVEGAERVTRPSYRLHMEDGTEIVCSQEHRWLCHVMNQNVWRATEEMVTPHHREGRPTRIVKAVDVWDEDRAWDAGYLAAAFDGEGCVSQHNLEHASTYGFRLALAQRENEMSATFEQALDDRGYSYSKTDRDGCFNHTLLGGRPEGMRLLGSIRPRRLLANFDPLKLGNFQRKDAVAVTEAEFIGDQEVVALKTSEGTFVAEGFASHNSFQRPNLEYFLGIARGRGIDVWVPDGSDLLGATHQYGFEDDHGLRAKHLERKDDFTRRLQAIHEQAQRVENSKQNHIRQHDAELQRLTLQRATIEGAMQATDWFLQSWTIPDRGNKEQSPLLTAVEQASAGPPAAPPTGDESEAPNLTLVEADEPAVEAEVEGSSEDSTVA